MASRGNPVASATVRIRIALPITIALTAQSAPAAVHVVRPDGTGDFPTIQAAILGAQDGDEILLEDGTYVGSGNRKVSFLGKAVTVRSSSGSPASCVIDCEDSGWAFSFAKGEQAGTTLEDVTIVRGTIPAVGTRSSSPTLRNLVIRDGETPAIQVHYGAPVITGCVLEANTSPGSFARGAVELSRSSALIESCRIAGNSAGPIPWYQAGGVWIGFTAPTPTTVRDCTIAGNDARMGGGVSVMSAARAVIEGCTITGNRASQGGGIFVSSSAGATISHTILRENCGGDASFDSPVQSTIACSIVPLADLAGSPTPPVIGADAVDVSPLSCEAVDCDAAPWSSGVYTLDRDSPAFSQACGVVGASPADCGTISGERASWGAIKARYR